MMSFIADGFKGIYKSGVTFTQSILPKWLHKAGVPESTAKKISTVAGGVAGGGIAVLGAYYLAAIAVSVPMFAVAIHLSHVAGSLAVAGVAGVLGGTGVILSTTGLGMCRELRREAASVLHHAKNLVFKIPAPPPVQNSGFDAGATAKPGFDKAAQMNNPDVRKPSPVTCTRGAAPVS